MNLSSLLTLARKHLTNAKQEGAARLCLADAIACSNNDDYDNAKLRALKSLAYSVGMFHRDYERADTFVRTTRWTE